MLCREVWLGFACSFNSSYSSYSFLFIFLFLSFPFYMISLLFKAPYHNTKNGQCFSTELKNPGCYLSIWRNLKPRANSVKNYLSLSVQSTTVTSWRSIRELQFHQLHSQLSSYLPDSSLQAPQGLQYLNQKSYYSYKLVFWGSQISLRSWRSPVPCRRDAEQRRQKPSLRASEEQRQQPLALTTAPAPGLLREAH